LWFLSESEKRKYSVAQFLNKNLNYYLDDLDLKYVSKISLKYLNERSIKMINEKYGKIFYDSEIKKAHESKEYELLTLSKKGKLTKKIEYLPQINESHTNFRRAYMTEKVTYFLDGKVQEIKYAKSGKTYKGKWVNMDVNMIKMEPLIDSDQNIDIDFQNAIERFNSYLSINDSYDSSNDSSYDYF